MANSLAKLFTSLISPSKPKRRVRNNRVLRVESLEAREVNSADGAFAGLGSEPIYKAGIESVTYLPTNLVFKPNFDIPQFNNTIKTSISISAKLSNAIANRLADSGITMASPVVERMDALALAVTMNAEQALKASVGRISETQFASDVGSRAKSAFVGSASALLSSQELRTYRIAVGAGGRDGALVMMTYWGNRFDKAYLSLTRQHAREFYRADLNPPSFTNQQSRVITEDTALLSKDSYIQRKIGDTFVAGGKRFQVADVYNPLGTSFKAVTYRNLDTGKLTIAFRGTELNDPRFDRLGDNRIFAEFEKLQNPSVNPGDAIKQLNKLNTILGDSVTNAQLVVNSPLSSMPNLEVELAIGYSARINRLYPGRVQAVTGHSQAGDLAILAGTANNIQVVTYNTAGMNDQLFLRVVSTGRLNLITNYVSSNDPLQVVNKAVGAKIPGTTHQIAVGGSWLTGHDMDNLIIPIMSRDGVPLPK